MNNTSRCPISPPALALAIAFASSQAAAQEPETTPAAETTAQTVEAPAAGPAEAPAKPKPPPYSIPFQLRPVLAVTVVRSDTAFAFYQDPKTHKSGSTVATTLLGSYKVTEHFAPMLRLGVVQSSPPDAPAPAPQSAANFMNPIVAGTYALALAPNLKVALFLGLSVPIGSGGGNTASGDSKAANTAGIRARSALDNAMLAVNDLTIFPGVGLAYVGGGVSAQVEATVLQLTRVRGEEAQKDASKTNLTAGLHLGYFFLPVLSAGVEVRHQRWLSTPKTIQGNPAYDEATLRDTTTVAVGPRFHIKLGEATWIRPALAFVLPIDDPMAAAKYKIFQVDVPVIF